MRWEDIPPHRKIKLRPLIPASKHPLWISALGTTRVGAVHVVNHDMMEPHARIGVGVRSVRVLEVGLDVCDDAVSTRHGQVALELPHAGVLVSSWDGEGAISVINSQRSWVERLGFFGLGVGETDAVGYGGGV